MFYREVNIGGLKIGPKHPPKVMGVVNLSPESFFADSVADNKRLLDIVTRMVEDGAHIIDIGGTSTAPKQVYDTTDTPIKTEIERIRSALEILREEIKVPISIDTTSTTVAETALDLGATLVNDISGLQHDCNMAKLVTERDVPVILMANCSRPCDCISDSIDNLKKSLEIAREAGIPNEHIILDPGIGFGKPAEVDYDILQHLNRYKCLGYPLLVGVSRKAFIGNCIDEPRPESRLEGTIATSAIAVERGADIIRAHDIREAIIASKIGYAIRLDVPIPNGQAEFCILKNEREVELILEEVGVGSKIRRSLSKKGVTLNILLSEISVSAALILKQELLALGGDAAYHHDTIDFKMPKTDILLFGTPIVFERLIGKMKRMHYFGLKHLGESIDEILKNREQRL